MLTGVRALTGEDTEHAWQAGLGAHRQGRLAEAVGFYDRVIAGDPSFVPALGARGSAFLALGAFDKALADFDALLIHSPAHAAGLEGRGGALAALGQTEVALEAYRRAAQADPGKPSVFLNQGALLSQMQRWEEALACLDHALILDPTLASGHSARGYALEALGRLAEALESFGHAERLAPGEAEAAFKQSALNLLLDQPDAALAASDRVLAIQPDLAAAHYNRGRALTKLHRPQAALDSLDAALALDPNLADIHAGRGVSLHTLGRSSEALKAFDKALALNPGDAEITFNRSWVLLSLGDFEKGLPAMEARKRRAVPAGNQAPDIPEWTGEQPLPGKSILIHAEQGLGDSLQFCRYLPLLADRGARVIFACLPRLHPLISTLDPRIELIAEFEFLAPYDYHIALMSLPLAFGTRLDSIPAAIPYLSAEPARIAHWRKRVGERGFKIGVCWRSSPLGEKMGRVIGIEQFALLAGLPGVRLISLHREADNGDLTAPGAPPVETLGEDFDSGEGAFLDSAAVMHAMDLVISTDTSMVHLAGALGRPAWVALMFAPEWRWLKDRQDSPWYPGLRLFRQAAPGDWTSVFEAMACELSANLGYDKP